MIKINFYTKKSKVPESLYKVVKGEAKITFGATLLMGVSTSSKNYLVPLILRKDEWCIGISDASYGCVVNCNMTRIYPLHPLISLKNKLMTRFA